MNRSIHLIALARIGAKWFPQPAVSSFLHRPANNLARRQAAVRSFTSSTLVHHPAVKYDEQEMHQHRQWIANFKQAELQKDDFHVTFYRSGGPGGQNVNKLYTKAIVRLDLSLVDKHAPSESPFSDPKVWLTKDLVSRIVKDSQYYAASSHSLLVSSTRHRTQDANLRDCLEKIHSHVIELASKGLVGATSSEQKQRVKRMQEAEQRRKKQQKMKRSEVKSSRRFTG